MIREVTATGKDVNAAIDNGCAQLNIQREDAQFEIISLPKKSFFGLKTHPAKVRVYIELPDPKPAPAPKAEPQKEQRPQERPAPKGQPQQSQQQPKAPKQPRPDGEKTAEKPQEKTTEKTRESRGERPAKNQKPQGERKSKGERKPAPERKAPQEENSETAAAAPAPKAEPVEVEPTEEVRVKIQRAADYVTEIMKAMGFEDIQVTPRYYEDSVCLRLSGTGLGVIIGRRGETLDSLQYLVSLVANRGEGDYIRVNIDSGNYREKREKTLIALAKKLANTAVRTGKSTTLEPMNPYERRVIHGAVSQVKGATSASIGVDPNRRVVISAIEPPKKGGKGGEQRGGKGRGGRGDRGERSGESRRDRRPRPEGDRGGRGSAPKGEKAQPAQPVNDAELFADLPRGVPIRPDGTEKIVTPKPAPAPAPAPKKVERPEEEVKATNEAHLYGKIEL